MPDGSAKKTGLARVGKLMTDGFGAIDVKEVNGHVSSNWNAGDDGHSFGRAAIVRIQAASGSGTHVGKEFA